VLPKQDVKTQLSSLELAAAADSGMALASSADASSQASIRKRIEHFRGCLRLLEFRIEGLNDQRKSVEGLSEQQRRPSLPRLALPPSFMPSPHLLRWTHWAAVRNLVRLVWQVVASHLRARERKATTERACVGSGTGRCE
jgi:hypothetical protein